MAIERRQYSDNKYQIISQLHRRRVCFVIFVKTYSPILYFRDLKIIFRLILGHFLVHYSMVLGHLNPGPNYHILENFKLSHFRQ